jgi:hypothetical protein
MTAAWCRVFEAAKLAGVSVGITPSGGEPVHAVVTSVGSDFVAGDTEGQRAVAVVIPFRNIVCVMGATDPGPGKQLANPPASFIGMLENLMRLSKTVVVHTNLHRWSGVLVAVHSEFIDIQPISGPRRMVSVAAIVWVSVCGREGVDNT